MEPDERKLYVGSIARETSEDELRRHFAQYGSVSRAVVAKERGSSVPKGFGFVWFAEASSAKRALESEHVILGKKVVVKEAIPKPEHYQSQQCRPNNYRNCTLCGNSNSLDGCSGHHVRSKKIFVGGLPASLTDTEFKDFFKQFGEITDVVIMVDPSKRPRGFGFVTFALEESADNVMKKNFYELKGRYVEVKRAIPKEVRNMYNGIHDMNGRMGGGSSDGYWPVYYPSYPSSYVPFHGYDHFLSFYGPRGVPYGVGAYVGPGSFLPCNRFGPSYMYNMVGYSNRPIPRYNAFAASGVDTMVNQAESTGSAPDAEDLRRLEELQITDDISNSGCENGVVASPDDQ